MITDSKTFFALAVSLAGNFCTTQMASAESAYDYNDRQAQPRNYDDGRDGPGMSASDQRGFERYLESNKPTARRLYERPERIRDREFVGDHESLDDWLDSHARAAEAACWHNAGRWHVESNGA